ncbi:TonB-dependent receptor plug domain-containing protein [Enterovibrio sp. ZSDZ35]|uniref:TonB-dependent receptor plug domain-containing protein n=1 Tax=Enterovibrio qingdaonensis TaxID=2899818 RepID=A0ABT5QH65_9GAMM|nr:TonB-dependent receptor [Enterovibrio sp. ZSDZ35]MDD1780324.1 TonB-dependent receptor plug domain-containing protein [Enterovibrio sp. ZSDZ35]
MFRARLATTAVSLLLPIPLTVFAQTDLSELLDMPLEALSDTKVVSATKTALSLTDIPAATYVITSKEIKRSGVRSVADALTLAPGLHVAKFSNYDWGISARTTNETMSNSMLVMVDGRSVFNPMFSGVDWDLIPVSLENIDHIEVVLGPVGTIWGGNAVHAVINIITLDAEEAPKKHVSAALGNYHYQEYQVHHAGEVSDNLFMSGYAEFVQHMPWTSDQEIVQPHQDFRVYTERFGLRGDYQNLDKTISFQLGGIRSREDYQWGQYQPHFLNPGQDGEDFIAYRTEMLAQEYFGGLKFLQDLGDDRQWEQQFWITHSSSDGSDRNAYFTRYDSETSYQDANVFGGHLTVGLSYRYIDENFRPYSEEEYYSSPYVRVADQSSFDNQSVAAYFNYLYPITDTLQLMVGSRWQYFNLTHDTFAQPQVRLMQSLTDNQRVWAGWGRALVTPAQEGRTTDFHDNLYLSDVTFCYTANPTSCFQADYLRVIEYQGSEDIEVPTVDTFELGYRFWTDNRFQLDMNLFYSEEKNIPAWARESATQTPISGNSSPGTIGTIVEVHKFRQIDPLSAITYGGELNLKWLPSENLQINANYSYKRISADCHGTICSKSDTPMRSYENEPQHFASAQIMWDVTDRLWLSSVFHYASGSEPDEALQDVDYYAWPEVITWDLLMGIQPLYKGIEMTFTVENLFNDQINEFPESYSAFDNGTQYWLEVDWYLP